MSSHIENTVIIGGGPAGLAAATYLSRANLSPLVFAGSPPGGQLTLTTEVENFPGFESIMGPELIERMRSQAKKFGTRIVDENVLEVRLEKAPFEVVLREGAKIQGIDGKEIVTTVQTRTIIIATGAKALWLGHESETRLRGKGVSACATCDGFFFRDKVVGVVGGGDTALEEAMTLTRFAKKVYILHRRDSFRASKIMQDRVLNHEKIEVMWNVEVDEVLGSDHVLGVRLKSSVDQKMRDVELDGLFIAIGHKPDTGLFHNSVLCDEKGYVLTSASAALLNMEGKLVKKEMFDLKYQTATSVKGVFAAGDNVDHVYRQAATAAGMGVQAALDVERYIESIEQ